MEGKVAGSHEIDFGLAIATSQGAITPHIPEVPGYVELSELPPSWKAPHSAALAKRPANFLANRTSIAIEYQRGIDLVPRRRSVLRHFCALLREGEGLGDLARGTHADSAHRRRRRCAGHKRGVVARWIRKSRPRSDGALPRSHAVNEAPGADARAIWRRQSGSGQGSCAKTIARPWTRCR